MLNVATGDFVSLQARLIESLARSPWRGETLTWTGELPPGSPSHERDPYGFKLYAIDQALRRGYTSILWLDAPCIVSGSLDPVFSAQERAGHCFASGGDRLGHWASDACLQAFGIDRDAAMDLLLMNGAFIGLDFEHSRTREWYRRMVQQCDLGLFRGAALTEFAPADVRARNVEKDTGHLSSDPRCWGHRHDEAVGSCLAHLLGMEIDPLGKLFDLGVGSEAVVRCPVL